MAVPFVVLVLIDPYPAAAAPEVYFPSRLYVSGTLYYEPHAMAGAPLTGSRRGYPVEAWYFDNVCILSRTSDWALPQSGQPQRLVHAFWYDDTAPDGDFRQQQWISSDMNPLVVYDNDYAPEDARRANPLWHLIHYRMRNRQGMESIIPPEKQPSTGRLVKLHDPPLREQNVDVTFGWNYQVHDDRISSCALVVNTTFLSEPKPRPDESMITQRVICSNFDQEFTAVPRVVKSHYGHPNSVTSTTFEVSRVDRILPGTTPQAVLDHLTSGLHRVYETNSRNPDPPDLAAFTFTNIADSTSTSAQDLLNDKFAVVYTWASWAPQNPWDPSPAYLNKPPANSIERLKALHTRYRSTQDVAIFGISLDHDPEAARAFANTHGMPWANYFPTKELRSEAIARFGQGKVPNVILLSDSGEIIDSGISSVSAPANGAPATTTTLDHRVMEKHDAKAAGGYARLWVGRDVVSLLNSYDSIEIFELTGDHMEELRILAEMPPMVPPPMPGAVSTPTPVPKMHDMPTSIGILLLDSYPITKKGKLGTNRAANEMAELLLDDTMVRRGFGEESLPAPRRALQFRRGDETVSIVNHGPLDIYHNNQQVTSLMPTETGDKLFLELYNALAKAAGLTIKSPNQR